MPGDLAKLVELAGDLAFYRTVPDDGGLGSATWTELFDRVVRLPEAGETAAAAAALDHSQRGRRR